MTENTMAVAANEESGGKRKLIVGAGAAGLLVLGAAGYLLLSGGGSSNDASFALPVHHVKALNSSTTLKSNVPAVGSLPAASQVRIGRDPFSALYVVPVAPPSTTGTPSTSTGTSTTPGTTPGTGTTSPTIPAVPTTYRLALLKVTGTGTSRTAAFSVAGKTQYARVGSVFGRTSEVKLLSFQQSAKGVWSVTIQVGDDAPKDMNLNEVISVL
jgi:hypothetical protein